MALQWGNILLAEALFTGGVLMALGFIKAPRFLRRRKLARGFPWGYYTDQVPKSDPGYYTSDFDRDFMHDTGTQFGGYEGFGDFGEFSGFGEMGEFGANFAGGGDAGHGE
jgi:hypothetical protein